MLFLVFLMVYDVYSLHLYDLKSWFFVLVTIFMLNVLNLASCIDSTAERCSYNPPSVFAGSIHYRLEL